MKLKAILGGILVVALAGCGSIAGSSPRQQSAPALAAPVNAPLEADWRKGGIPKNFTVVVGEVIKVLPPDNHGLPHQKFVIRVFKPFKGRLLEVAHNVAMAPPVEPLQLGQPLMIRGVIYTGMKEGIHWTHHAQKPGDAGFIQTEDGAIFE